MHHNGTIPPSLRPLLRAYALGYITVTGPRLFGFLRVLSRPDIPLSLKVNLLYTILKTSTELHRFPTACAITVGGATALPRLIKAILQRLLELLSPERLRLLGNKFNHRLRFITTFLSAYLAFNLLNSDSSWSRKRALSLSKSKETSDSIINYETPAVPLSSPPLAGKTLDFTLFAFTRAIDVLVLTLLSTSSTSTHTPKTNPTKTSHLQKIYNPTTLFALSAAKIMHTWFYNPHRLPKSYTTWISSAAQIDPGLISALRLARKGDFLYGIDTGQSHLLEPLCNKLNLPSEWANPAQTIPIPCELYHSGAGPNCEIHALSRFIGSFLFAAKLYLPLNILSRLLSDPSRLLHLRPVMKLLKSTARSSLFLSTFITSFYYAVCLARTRLGPLVFSGDVITPQMWDSGLCVLAGCLTCGWSIALEEGEGKKWELAFFVLPRALAGCLPRRYVAGGKGMRVEGAVFAASCAVVLGSVVGMGGRGRVRGVFGRVLEGVVA